MSDLTIEQKEKEKQLFNYSNPDKVQQNMNKYQKSLGSNIKIKVYPSTQQFKKYMILDPNKNKWVHFGAFPNYYDFTYHNDLKRRQNYHKRFTNLLDSDNESINNPYSAYNLSLYLLW